MKKKRNKTLDSIFARPPSANLKWPAVCALLRELGADISEREGSRVSIFLFGQVKVMHRPHPSPDMDKGAITMLRKWLEENGVQP